MWQKDGSLDELVLKRYQSFDSELGALVEVICVWVSFIFCFQCVLSYPTVSAQPYTSQQAGKADFELLEKKAMEWGEPKVPSAKQVIQHYVIQVIQHARRLVNDR